VTEKNAEPSYEAEDCGCSCNNGDSPMDSEWEWRPEEGCYVCAGCGEEQ
jgi:hypothetical protein